MQENFFRLVQPQATWQIVEITATSLDFSAEANALDLVVCEHLSGSCADLDDLLARVTHALKPGGLLAVVDTIVPGSRLRGKKAVMQRRAGDYVNAMMKLVIGENGRYLSREEWHDALRVANITITHEETTKHVIDFHTWVREAKVSPLTSTRLRAMLKQAPEPAAAFLTPQSANDRITFYLTEAIFVGKLESGA
jgi:hypothetical protein